MEANPLTTSKTIISNPHGNIVECVDAYVGTKQWAITKMYQNVFFHDSIYD